MPVCTDMARLEVDRTPCAGITQIRFEGLLPVARGHSQRASALPCRNFQLSCPLTLAVESVAREWPLVGL